MKKTRLLALALCAGLSTQALAATAPAKAPITHESLWMMKRVGAPVVSPDGKWVVYAINEPAYEGDKAVNDLWLCQQMGFVAEQLNAHGCSLVYGHPQAPTGMRGIVELIEDLTQRGGGIGLFTGCAAGDSAAAVVVKVQVTS